MSLIENAWRKRVQNPQSWFNAGEFNEYIAKFLLRKYNSYYKKIKNDSKKQKINQRDGDLHT